MVDVKKTTFNFSKGFLPDGGPFTAADGYFRDGRNVIHEISGEIGNRPGIELLDEDQILTLTDVTSTSYVDVPSTFYGEFTKLDGTILKTIILRTGKFISIFANDGVTYTNSLENLTVNTPNFVFELDDVSVEARYYKTSWAKDGNTLIMNNGRSPIYKLVWGNKTTGSETFSAFKVELTEINEDIYSLTRAPTKGKSIVGWFSREIPLVTATTDYIVDEYIIDAAPEYVVTLFDIDENDVSTIVADADFTYTETLDTSINLCTASLSYPSATDGHRLRVYFGRQKLTAFNASLAKEDIVVSNRTKDYNGVDTSFTPNQTAQFGGRFWFLGVDGPLDGTDANTYPGLSYKFKKVWISPLFASTIYQEELSNILCKPARFPYDIDDNTPSPLDGGVLEIDNAAKLKDSAAYGPSIFLIAENGLWAVTGPNDYFDLQQVIQKKIIDHPFSCYDPMVSTENGIVVFGDSEVFFVQQGTERQIVPLAEGRISSFYKQIPTLSKKYAFTRYDKYNKRVYFFWTENTTKLAQNKYQTYAQADKALVYDFRTQSWLAPIDISNGAWSIIDSVTVPADSYFDETDVRFAKYKQINLVTLIKKNGAYTDITFGILEGKQYCTDYFDTIYQAPFNSYIEAFNSFVDGVGAGSEKQVARMNIFMKRQEQADADADGYYEFPGALYMDRRWNFADLPSAGPLYEYSLNEAQDTWVNQRRLIYFPNTYGSTGIGGQRPPFEVIQHKTKVRGRGKVIAFRFGNAYGDTTAYNTLTEEEKGWGLYGYELSLQVYDLGVK